MKIVYVAGPFAGKTAWDITENVRAAERVGLEVARLGHLPVIPHCNSAHFFGQLDESFWLAGYTKLLGLCDALILVPDWERSKGTCAEKAEAERLGLPVFFSVRGLGEWKP
jgi:hypothetical protein